MALRLLTPPANVRQSWVRGAGDQEGLLGVPAPPCFSGALSLGAEECPSRISQRADPAALGAVCRRSGSRRGRGAGAEVSELHLSRAPPPSSRSPDPGLGAPGSGAPQRGRSIGNSQYKPCSCSTCLSWGQRPCPDRALEAESQDWPAVGPCCSSPPCPLCSSRRRSPDPRSPTHPQIPGQPSGLRVPGRVGETEIQRAGEVPGCGRLGHQEPPALLLLETIFRGVGVLKARLLQWAWGGGPGRRTPGCSRGNYRWHSGAREPARPDCPPPASASARSPQKEQ